MTTYVGIVGLADPLVQTANVPVPILFPVTVLALDATTPLPAVANNPKPIIGAHVIAILFPTVQGGSYGVPI